MYLRRGEKSMDIKGVISKVEYWVATLVVLLVYTRFLNNWLILGAFYLVPDLAAVGFGLSPRIGQTAYNTTHTLIGPLCLLLLGLILPVQQSIKNSFMSLSLIWLCHITVDRGIGWGLFPRD